MAYEFVYGIYEDGYMVEYISLPGTYGMPYYGGYSTDSALIGNFIEALQKSYPLIVKLSC